jgi:hypothetical protein
MNQQARKKNREKLMLRRFLEATKFDASIADDNRESPDFIVSIEGRVVGIEIADVFIFDANNPNQNGMLPQAAARIANEIVERAWRLHHSAGGFPAHVSVSFSEHKNLNALNRVAGARKLATLVGNLELSEWEQAQWVRGMLGDLPAEIHSVRVCRLPNADMSCWYAGRGGWIAPVTTEMLQRPILEKANRLATYRQFVAENWLLLTADSFHPAQLVEVRSDFDPSTVISPFERTFFYRSPDMTYLELGASKSPAD